MSKRPKPTALRVIEGNREHRPIPDNPQPRLMFPDAPEHLDEVAKEEWRERGAELFDMGLLTIVDLPAFEAYCVWYSKFRQADSDHARKEAGHQMRMFMVEFGMTPSSRSKLDVKDINGGKSGMEEFA